MTNRPDSLDNIPSNPLDDDVGIPTAPETIDFEFPLVSESSEEDLRGFGLNMVDDYRDFKREVLTWLATYGKHPEKGEGLSETTLKSTHYKLETVFRWLWKYEEKYTTDFTPQHADRFIDLLNQTDSMIDSTVLHHAKGIKRYFKYTNQPTGRTTSGNPSRN